VKLMAADMYRWACVADHRVVDQLRCALKAKNAIIEQLEDEKRDAVTEATSRLELTIAELTDKLRQLRTSSTDVSSLLLLSSAVVSRSSCLCFNNDSSCFIDI